MEGESKSKSEREMRGRPGTGQLPDLQVDLGRQLQKKGNSHEVSPTLLEIGPNEQAESRRCSVAENQRTSSLYPLLLLDHELH